MNVFVLLFDEQSGSPLILGAFDTKEEAKRIADEYIEHYYSDTPHDKGKWDFIDQCRQIRGVLPSYFTDTMNIIELTLNERTVIL